MNPPKTSIIIGLVENIRILGRQRQKEISAKIDTGATKSSIDKRIVDDLSLGPIIKSKIVKSAHGTGIRPVIEAEIIIAGRHIKAEFTIADRIHMKYPVLIGQNILKIGFLIDPNK